jgi:hypothetical protein
MQLASAAHRLPLPRQGSAASSGPTPSSAKDAWPARSSTEATVARVETATLAQIMQGHPELSERFMAFLLLPNSQVEADLVDQLFSSSEKRLVRLLVMLA